MPDGPMTPEVPSAPKSSIEEFRQAGPSSEQMKSWQGPEWKSELPDIRMQLSDDLLKRLQEREDYERSMQGSEYDKGRSVEAVIARHPDPETVKFVLRALQLKEETFNTNGEPDNRWDVSHRANTLADRAIALRMPIQDIKDRGLVEPLTPDELEVARLQRGKTIPVGVNEQNLAKPKHVEGFGLESYTVTLPLLAGYKTNKKGDRTEQEFRMVPENLVYLGKDDNERAERSKRFDKLRDEVTARALMMQLWGHHTTYYYALQKLAEGHYFGTTLSSEGLGVLFNLEGQKEGSSETSTGVPLKSLGEKIDTAMRLYYVVALCEKPTRFRDLMRTPGWKQFLFPDTPKNAEKNLQIFKKLIGAPGEWEDEVFKRDKNGNWVQIGKRKEGDTKYEREGGYRGELTQRNIFAESEPYVESKVNEAIEAFLGGGKDASYVSQTEAETARRIAFRLFRLFLLADQEGYELVLEDSQKKENPMDPFSGIKIIFENAPAASDFGKLTHPDMYAGKSFRKGRDYMPSASFLHAREYYSRFMVDFFRHAAAATEIKVTVDGAEKYLYEERSLMERWWGYADEYKDEWTDREGNKHTTVYGQEGAKRLGDLPWSTYNEPSAITLEQASMLGLPVGGYHHEIFKTLWLSGFMAGGDDRAHAIVSETNHDPRRLTDLGWWRKFWKMLDVGIKDGVALEGNFRGRIREKDKIRNLHKVKIVQNFIMGLQSLPQWEEWDRQEVKAKNRKSKQPSEPGLTQRIVDVATEALRESGVVLEIPPRYDDLLRR